MLSHLRSASILLMLSAACWSTACASIGRNRSGLVRGLPAVSRGGVIPGSQEKLEALPAGSPLVVTLKSGERLEGAFKAVGPALLTLTDRAGMEFSIPMAQVEKITARGTRDRLTNGVAIGAGIGLGAALAILAAAGSQDGYVLPSAKVAAPLLLSGVGGVVGALVDRAHKGEQVLYRAR
jgi:hypothetical protein